MATAADHVQQWEQNMVSKFFMQKPVQHGRVPQDTRHQHGQRLIPRGTAELLHWIFGHDAPAIGRKIMRSYGKITA